MLSLGSTGSEAFIEQTWPIGWQEPYDGEVPRIRGLFVNDTARILFVRASTESPFDWSLAGGEFWWRMSLDTGVYQGTTQPRDHWEQIGQSPQRGVLVSCEQIPTTQLLVVHWAAVRGVQGNCEVGERIQIVDKDAYVLGELPIRQFLQVIFVERPEDWEDAVIDRVKASASKPMALGPLRVGIFGDDDERRATLVCSPSVESPVGWSFLLYSGQ
ncbi:MAG: hypothetical protein ABI054_13600 [Planctomycetota bacterium]